MFESPVGALLATSSRSGYVENRHYGSAVVVGQNGEVLFELGHPEQPIFGRSANKPIQVLSMLRQGVRLTEEQIAIATASNSGGLAHQLVSRSILANVGLTENHLRNAAYRPLGEPEFAEFLQNGGTLSTIRPIMSDCSGKHAAMLATCVRNNWALDTYLDTRHPLQIAISETINELCGPLHGIGVDGCGAPAHRISLTGLAQSYSALAVASGGHEFSVAEAMRNQPELIGGRGRDISQVLETAERWIAKDGADGVLAVATPSGHAVAVKIGDGTNRARVAIALRALALAGVDVPRVPLPTVLSGATVIGELSPAF